MKYNISMEEIDTLREKIDDIDAQWVALLGERFKVTAEIGRIKARDNLSSVDPGREAKQMERIENLALESGFEPDLARQILRLVIDEAVRNHKLQAP
jgi:chorismate mutase